MTDKTGGPVFPYGCSVIQDQYAPHGGMTLRDYFAAKAMQAFLMRPSSRTCPDEIIAQDSYDTADAIVRAAAEIGKGMA